MSDKPSAAAMEAAKKAVLDCGWFTQDEPDVPFDDEDVEIIAKALDAYAAERVREALNKAPQMGRCPHCHSAFGLDMVGKNCYVCNTANVVADPPDSQPSQVKEDK